MAKAKEPKDKLDECPKCGCDGCYVQPINRYKKSYFCWGCGYQTSDLMKEGEFDFEQYEETLPELYKDIKYTDDKKRVWYPITINLETKGTVFAYGTTPENWQWAAIKAILLTEAEQEEPKYRGATHKSDAKSLRQFGNDFIEALDYINFFE